ncbi:MAG: APC family permease [Aestuariivirga sp.]|nr:APC family permease [Aestuariivirga sp.]
MTDKPVPVLRRALNLPWLVFYGVGVTVGAGVFALIGEVVRISGDHAVWAFLIAGLVAAFTALSYAVLASAYPRAAGEAIYVKMGFGELAGRIVGLGVVAVAITSSAVISLAFAGYLGALTGFHSSASVIGVLALLGLVAWFGVRESVGFAAIVTVLEVGTLAAVVIGGLPLLATEDAATRLATLPSDPTSLVAVFAGAFLAFFAYIGFEDIVNMAEETKDPHRAIPAAIGWTLGISLALYGLVAAVAVSFPDRQALVGSNAPLALLFERTTDYPAAPVAAMASIAMINGILVQIVMASRVLYGMAREGMVPVVLGRLDAKRATPAIAIALITAAILALALFVPFLRLASLTSFIILLIFMAVNASLYIIGARLGAPEKLRRWRWWGVFGAVISFGLAAMEALS